jgi:predicted nucleotidyltransferase
MAELQVPQLQEMVSAIVAAVAPQEIVVFGSWAKGTAGPDSDIDLLVIQAEPFGPGCGRRQEMVRIWRALAQFQVAKDVLVYSRDEVDHWRGALNHIIARALREGVTVYEQP